MTRLNLKMCELSRSTLKKARDAKNKLRFPLIFSSSLCVFFAIIEIIFQFCYNFPFFLRLHGYKKEIFNTCVQVSDIICSEKRKTRSSNVATTMRCALRLLFDAHCGLCEWEKIIKNMHSNVARISHRLRLLEKL